MLGSVTWLSDCKRPDIKRIKNNKFDRSRLKVVNLNKERFCSFIAGVRVTRGLEPDTLKYHN